MSINEIVHNADDFDGRDDAATDAFILSITNTPEYEADVVNEIDFDFDDLLHAIATSDDKSIKEQLSVIKDAIRENAVDLFCNIQKDNDAPRNEYEANGFASESDFNKYING